MNYSNKPCLICGEGHLSQTIDRNPVSYKGVSRELALYGSVCDTCGSEQADAQDTRLNKRAMLAFKKEVNGLLSAEEIAAIREQYGLNQQQAAKLFGGGPVAFSKYESNDVAQSDAMNKLLSVAQKNVNVVIDLARMAGEIDIMNRLKISQARKFDHAAFTSTRYCKSWKSQIKDTEMTVVSRTSNVTYLNQLSAA